MLVYGHFWSLKTISRRSENHKFSRDRFFLFGPGRARREQPNAGLHLGVRAFVRSVSHVKVFFASLPINRLEKMKFRNQLCATRDRVESYRMKLVDSPLDSPASPLQLSVSAAS